MFTIVKSTAKAHLLQTADGRETWIKAAWLRADGTLTPAGEKALGLAKTREEAKKLNDFVFIKTVSRETDKAVGVKIQFATAKSNFNNVYDSLIYFPKSLIKCIDGIDALPSWVVNKKLSEFSNETAGRFHCESYDLKVYAVDSENGRSFIGQA
jgi:hypothetical protein